MVSAVKIADGCKDYFMAAIFSSWLFVRYVDAQALLN
jgi:hypothetical protein